MGLKLVSAHFRPILAPKSPLWTHFSPLTKTHLKPILSGNKSFSKKKGPEAALTQHNLRPQKNLEAFRSLKKERLLKHDLPVRGYPVVLGASLAPGCHRLPFKPFHETYGTYLGASLASGCHRSLSSDSTKLMACITKSTNPWQTLR